MQCVVILLRYINEMGVRGMNDLGMGRMGILCELLEIEVDDEEDGNTPKM
jgi:hypothetical protein